MCTLDMRLPSDDESNEEGDKKKAVDDEEAKVEDGLDSRYNKKMKEKLDRAKSKVLRDMSITVSQKISEAKRGALESRKRRMQFKSEESSSFNEGSGRIREELTDPEGTIVFMTGDVDGEVDICVQSISASIKTPSRFSLNVSMVKTSDGENGDSNSSSGGVLDNTGVKTQMSRLERDMQTLSNRVQTILSNADSHKEQEVEFHNKSIEMNRASKFWPAIRLMVLFITGFTQANNITRYLRNHHIGL